MRRFVESLGYATDGIRYASLTQQNIRIQGGLLLGSVLLSVISGMPWWTWAALAYVWGAVMVVELVNTALEDLSEGFWGLLYHPRARFVKDMAAGAVLLAACMALLVTVTIFVYYRARVMSMSPAAIAAGLLGCVGIIMLARFAGQRPGAGQRNGGKSSDRGPSSKSMPAKWTASGSTASKGSSSTPPVKIDA